MLSPSPTVLLWASAQSHSERCQAAWLSGLKNLSACGFALIDRPSGLSTSDKNNNNNNDNNNNDSKHKELSRKKGNHKL